MKHFAALLALGIATAVIAADAVKPQLTVMRLADRSTIEGPAANFTGKAKIDRQVRPEDSRPLGSMVSFEAGARTAWHTHPLGQTLIVTSGCGWIQVEGGKKEEIRAGDVIWTPPNAKHWHGAQPGSPLSHYSIVEPLNGSSAAWMEKVFDEQYGPKDATTCKTPKT
ncbi:MAG TPA: cupin domain-containing protein [Steroidobacteraceae bacterium]|nr:cupin domain-containing protein [Steroidobacteraceae bacterium]